jgi:D-beta-D-heptose 7-phosphate kinase / D-beta-D-heptose 1-phosphate adenosyltransferase
MYSALRSGKKNRILVIGDLMIDHYLWGNCERISPEAPVPIVSILNEEWTLGGAGNVVKNLASFGVDVDVMTVIGDDIDGERLCALLSELNTSTEGIYRDKNRKTTKKSRIISSNQQMLRIDKETVEPISNNAENFLLEYFYQNHYKYNTILISDYLKGTITSTLLSVVIPIANDRQTKIIVDPKGKDYSKYRGVTIIKPNRKEASLASGTVINDTTSLKQVGAFLQKEVECDAVIITMSEQGMAIFDKSFEIIPTKASEVFDVTGAGDTVLASLGICVNSGMNIKDACIFSNHAAAIVVSKLGSAVTTIDAVLDHIETNLNEEASYG